MRIALLTYSTKPRGGVVHTLYLAEALARLGQDVTVWTLGRGGDAGFFREVDPAVDVVVVPFEGRDGEQTGQRILRSIEVLRAGFDPAGYDVVHAQDCISANAVGRCVRTIHHLDTFTTPELVACHDRAVHDPIHRICVSAAVAAEVADQYGENATVIPNGVDAPRFARAATDDGAAVAARDRWHARLGRYVLALGGVEPRKGSLDLLEAFAAARPPGVRLVFGGGETLFDYRDYRATFDTRAAELGLDCVMLGTVADAELPALVAAADALAFVSTKEGFGLAAMEALAAGVPVLCRDLPVLREVFGSTVTYADDVPSIAAGLLAVLAGEVPAPDAGRALAGAHTWLFAAKAHLDLYQRVAS